MTRRPSTGLSWVHRSVLVASIAMPVTASAVAGAPDDADAGPPERETDRTTAPRRSADGPGSASQAESEAEGEADEELVRVDLRVDVRPVRIIEEQSNDGGAEPWLDRVIQGSSDVTPLTRSLRQPGYTLAQPVDFQHLYTVKGREDLFVRQNGAVYGMFPRSDYVRYKGQTFPVWPPGTVFYIGTPSSAQRAMAGLPVPPIAPPRPGEVVGGVAGAGPIGARVRARLADLPRPATPTVDVTDDRPFALDGRMPRYMRDETYRRSQLRALESARAVADEE